MPHGPPLTSGGPAAPTRLASLPLQQISSDEQAVPHLPQWAQLEEVSTQAPPQSVFLHGGA